MSGRVSKLLAPFSRKHATLSVALSGLDHAALRRLVCEAGRSDRSARRYGHAARWLGRAWSDAARLGLDRSPPLSLLDLGTGPGYFPFICQMLGHRCVGLDAPNASAFCAKVRHLLGVREFVEHEIAPNTPLPPLGRFDVVTAWRANFHFIPRKREIWTISEWEFFLNDLRANVLVPHGRIVMKLCRLNHLQRANRYDEGVLFAALARLGATQDGKLLWLRC